MFILATASSHSSISIFGSKEGWWLSMVFSLLMLWGLVCAFYGLYGLIALYRGSPITWMQTLKVCVFILVVSVTAVGLLPGGYGFVEGGFYAAAAGGFVVTAAGAYRLMGEPMSDGDEQERRVEW
jgi:hypothetical protein